MRMQMDYSLGIPKKDKRIIGGKKKKKKKKGVNAWIPSGTKIALSNCDL